MGRPTFAEALESLTEQTFRNFEAIVVDMTADGVQSTIAAVRARLPHIEHLRIGGPLTRPRALNRGAASAAGDALTILDDDNRYLSRHLEHLAAGLETTDADIVYAGSTRQTLAPDGRLLSAEDVPPRAFDFERLVLGNFIFASTLAFRKSAWKRVGGFDERFQIFEDWDFLIRVAQSGRIEALSGCSSIARNFTGHRDLPTHRTETRDLRRCTQGLTWVHRDVRRRALRARSDRLRFLVRSSRAALDRMRNFPFLVDWWWHTRHLVAGRTS